MSTAPIRQLALSEAQEIWNSVAQQNKAVMPFFSYEWYKTWTTVYAAQGEPYILLVNEATLAPFIRKGTTVEFTDLQTDCNDLVGPIAGMWPPILEFLKQNGITNLNFRNIPAQSETVSFFTSLTQQNPAAGTLFPEQTAPILMLPSSFDTYLASINYESRRRYKKFMKENPEAQVIKSTSPETDVNIFIALMKLNPRKLATFNPEKELFFQQIASSCKPWVWIQLLQLNNEIPAALSMYHHDKTVLLYNSGFNREKYSNAGTFLLISTIKQAIEQGFTEFNFLRGKEQYKYDLRATDVPLYSLTYTL